MDEYDEDYEEGYEDWYYDDGSFCDDSNYEAMQQANSQSTAGNRQYQRHKKPTQKTT